MKKTALALALALSCLGAQAGFVSDFVDDAVSRTQVTKAGVVESAALNTATAGGFVYRAPRRDFTGVGFAPPSLKAGCGGIDLFLGAFSIPSREEFLNFLKSVGSALPGLAFQLALQTMAPDLNEQVSRYTDLIREYSSSFTDSCETAGALLESTGAAEMLQRAGFQAANALRSSGEASDQAEAVRQVRADGGRAMEKAPQVTDLSGNVVDAPELNLTWALLAGVKGSSGWNTASFRELLMTLVGTTVFTKRGEGADAVPQAFQYPPADLLPILFGETGGNAAVPVLTCKETKRCLSVTRKDVTDLNLVTHLREAADRYLQALRARNPSLVTDDDLILLSSLSSVPLLRVLNLASLTRWQGVASQAVDAYVQAAAYEALVNAVEELASGAQAALAASSAGSASAQHARELERISARLDSIRRDLYERSDRMMQSMVRAGALIQSLEHLERSLRGQQARYLSEVLPSGQILRGQ